MAQNITSSTQFEILNLIHNIKSEKDLSEIKSLLIAYFSDKLIREIDKSFDERAFTSEIFEKWKQEHFRKRA